MSWLLDTNILLRMAQPSHAMHEQSLVGVERLLEAGERVCVTAQNFTEFWSVATRPAGSANGLGMTPAQARQEVVRLGGILELVPETERFFPAWLALGFSLNPRL